MGEYGLNWLLAIFIAHKSSKRHRTSANSYEMGWKSETLMPSRGRRNFLATAGSAALIGSAGCTALGSTRPDLKPSTGLSQDTSHTLEDELVYVTESDGHPPTPPTTTDSLADASAVLATATADRMALAEALRAGKPVALAGDNATTTVRSLLDRIQDTYWGGLETVPSRPVPLIVADPRGEAVDTFTFVGDDGWSDPVLDPFGWALTGRVPECDTFVPTSSTDNQFEYAGAAHVVGRLQTGETYISRSESTVDQQDDDLFIRLRTKLHTAANDGYAIEEGVRETDLPDDQHLHTVFPNPHTKNGVEVANVSDTSRSTFRIQVAPESPRARSALTACGGFRTAGALEYDYLTSFQWKQTGLLTTKRHYAGPTGRGVWNFA